MKSRYVSKIATLVLVYMIACFACVNLAYADSTVTVPDHRTAPRLVDNARLLNNEEVSSLTSNLDELSEELQLDICIVTTQSLGGKSPRTYADDFYDSKGYGFGPNRDGILLLVAMDTRDWYITTTGYAITAFTDAGIKFIGEQIIGDLGDGDYYSAFKDYSKWCKKFVNKAYDGKPYDVGHMPNTALKPGIVPFGILLGSVGSFILASIKKKALKTVKHTTVAADYIVPGSLVVTANNDFYIRSNISSYVESNSSSSGGSSTHISSSGTTHGGGGGKF